MPRSNQLSYITKSCFHTDRIGAQILYFLDPIVNPQMQEI
jgi:hypothetical protein